MNASRLQEFRTRLMEMVRRLSGESAELRHEVLGDQREPEVSIGQEQHTVDDLSREKADEEVAMAMLGNEEQLLTECNAALERIERGTFGKCEDCGRPIAVERLEVAPYLRRCIQCARKAGPNAD